MITLSGIPSRQRVEFGTEAGAGVRWSRKGMIKQRMAYPEERG